MNQQAAALTPIRRNDIDWLRICAVYFFLIFQAAWVFDPESFSGGRGNGVPGYLKSIGFFVSQWYVPLVFLISGWSRKNSMQQRIGIDSIRERMYRLVIPFATGCILIWPLITYVSLIDQSSIASQGGRLEALHAKSFLDFLPDCFTMPGIHAWSHLWLLPSLFVFTLLSWPFFSWMLKKKVTPLKISRAWVYFPIIPLSLLQTGIGAYKPGTANFFGSWGGAAYLFVYFVIGFVISRYSAYERAIHQEDWHAGIIGVSVFLFMEAFSSSLSPQASVFMGSIAGWCCVVAMLGFAKRFLENTTIWFSYLRESALPVYVFHQIPILVLSLFITRLDTEVSLRYMLLLAVSVGSTLVFYHFFVRRFSFLQACFGMKPGKEPSESWKDQVFNRDRG